MGYYYKEEWQSSTELCHRCGTKFTPGEYRYCGECNRNILDNLINRPDLARHFL